MSAMAVPEAPPMEARRQRRLSTGSQAPALHAGTPDRVAEADAVGDPVPAPPEGRSEQQPAQ